MGFLCLFFPALILLAVRRKVLGRAVSGRDCDLIGIAFQYACGCLCINAIILAALYLFRHYTEYVYDMLNRNSVFALKYLVFSVGLSIALPFMEKVVREKASLSVEWAHSLPLRHFSFAKEGTGRVLLLLTAAVAIGMHFIRIFDNVFWCDEAIPLEAMRMSWSRMIERAAQLGHVPFHYALIWLSRMAFGEHPAMYHFVSLIPYIVIVLLSVTVIYRWFGTIPAFVLISLSTLLGSSVRYNVEVRMYSWCQLFILIAYLAMYQVVRKGGAKHYLLMFVSSLAAVYTHSFALAAVGILYFSLLLIVILKKKEARWKSAWKAIVSGIGVLVLFLPWMLYARRERGEMISEYGLPLMSTRRCIDYIFSSKYSGIILCGFMLVFVLAVSYGIGLLNISRSDGKTHIRIVASISKWAMSEELAWIITGPAVTFGVIFASQAFSRVAYPITLERYLYPSMILTWLSFGICISKCGAKNIYALALAGLLAFGCLPAYCGMVRQEAQTNELQEQTLEAIGELDSGDYIILEKMDLNYYLQTTESFRYYFPQTESVYPEDDAIPPFREGKDNWMFSGCPFSEDEVERIQKRGYRLEQVADDGNIGGYRLWIYKAEKI